MRPNSLRRSVARRFSRPFGLAPLLVAAVALTLRVPPAEAQAPSPSAPSASSARPADRAPDPACPPGMAYLPEVKLCIDRWEGRVEVWSNDEGFLPHSPYEPVDPLEGHLRAVTAPDVVPQSHIAGSSARAACFGASKTLCPMRAWRRACMGSHRWSFPYGALREAGTCNDGHKDHPVMSLFPEAGNGPWAFAMMNDARLNQQAGTVAKTGSHPGCTNETGTFDLVGNLHEWIDDEEGTFLGGYYMDTAQHGAGCLYVTAGHSFRYFDYSVGFRCCASPSAPSPASQP